MMVVYDDALQLVFERLGRADLCRARAVCRQWNDVVKRLDWCYPWVFLDRRPQGGVLWCPRTGAERPFSIPSNCRVLAGSIGLLLCESPINVCGRDTELPWGLVVVNPLTGASKPLPPFPIYNKPATVFGNRERIQFVVDANTGHYSIGITGNPLTPNMMFSSQTWVWKLQQGNLRYHSVTLKPDDSIEKKLLTERSRREFLATVRGHKGMNCMNCMNFQHVVPWHQLESASWCDMEGDVFFQLRMPTLPRSIFFPHWLHPWGLFLDMYYKVFCFNGPCCYTPRDNRHLRFKVFVYGSSRLMAAGYFGGRRGVGGFGVVELDMSSCTWKLVSKVALHKLYGDKQLRRRVLQASKDWKMDEGILRTEVQDHLILWSVNTDVRNYRRLHYCKSFQQAYPLVAYDIATGRWHTYQGASYWEATPLFLDLTIQLEPPKN